MNEKNESVAEGLFEAMQAESEGYHFYLMAARSTQDPKGRRVFESLANEELEHLRFLQAQYKSVMDTGMPDGSVLLGKRGELPGPSPIFSEGIKSRVNEAHFEMSALSVGIRLELSSEKYYRDRSEKASDPVVRGFYGELAEWEAYHYQTLLRQQEALKEEYWASGGFSPF